MGKLVQVPAVLLHVTLRDLCNHFQKELLEDADWAITPAEMDYSYFQKDYILREETLHFPCTAYNMIHPDRQIEIPARYQRPQYDTTSTVDTPEPMDDEPPVLPQRAAVPGYPRWEPGYAPAQPSYAYPHGYGPPGSQGPSRLFAAAAGGDGAGTSRVPPGPVQPPDKPQPLSGPPPSGLRRWAPPRYPPLPGPPDPPALWTLDAANLGPWASLKPEMVKVPDDFNGDSNDIARFFSQCDMYFSIFNQHFYYHPHKVIFCASHFKKEAQVWWELCARELGRDAQGFQLYPAYEQFVEEVRRRFWKDANAKIKFAQWEGLRQSNFPDGDLFFQQFESLAFEAGVLGIDIMMMAQVKKACRATTKDIIYASDADPPADYPAWKKRILRIDHNWRTRKAEQRGGKVTEWKQQAKMNTTPATTKGNQQQTSVPEKTTGTGTTYGGQGKPMDIDTIRAKTKCFGCSQLGHFKQDCPKRAKTKEEHLRHVNYYWDHVGTKEKTDDKIEEVKDEAEQ